MFDIHFEVNGRRVNEHDFADVLTKAMLVTVKNHIKKEVGSIRCAEHGSSAQIVAKGRDLANLSFTVSGCCQKLIDNVTKRLSK